MNEPTELALFRREMREGFDAIDRRFGTVDQRFEAVDRRLDAIDQRFAAVDARLDGMERRVDAEARHARVLALIEEVRSDLKLLLEHVAPALTLLGRNDKRLDAHGHRIESLETRVTALERRRES